MLEKYNKRRSIDLDAQCAIILLWRSSLVAGNPINLTDSLLKKFANVWADFHEKLQKEHL